MILGWSWWAGKPNFFRRLVIVFSTSILIFLSILTNIISFLHKFPSIVMVLQVSLLLSAFFSQFLLFYPFKLQGFFQILEETLLIFYLKMMGNPLISVHSPFPLIFLRSTLIHWFCNIHAWANESKNFFSLLKLLVKIELAINIDSVDCKVKITVR